MCHTVPMANREDHLLRAVWTADQVELPAHALRWLRSETGLTPTPAPVHAVTASPSELPEKVRDVLAEIVGDSFVLVADSDRLWPGRWVVTVVVLWALGVSL